jgi:RNA polymerase sigma-70 factor (ECF subfamily)
MKELDSQELEIIVQKAKNGDKEAFASLYTQYFTPLYKYIYFRVPSKATAEDLTQDVFVKAYMALERYSYSGTSPLAYFYTIARNGIIDYRRKKKTARMDEAELLSQPSNGKWSRCVL